jgi:hypothetical protein
LAVSVLLAATSTTDSCSSGVPCSAGMISFLSIRGPCRNGIVTDSCQYPFFCPPVLIAYQLRLILIIHSAVFRTVFHWPAGSTLVYGTIAHHQAECMCARGSRHDLAPDTGAHRSVPLFRIKTAEATQMEEAIRQFTGHSIAKEI